CENHFVGMPCGILDQGVSGFGKKDSIVFIDCLTEEFSAYPLPKGCKFWLFNSTKKHALVDGLYAARHNECMEAAKILSDGGEPRPLRAFSADDLEAAKGKMTDVVYRRAKHVIDENERVMKTKDFLLAGDIRSVGKMLNASHESSRTLFENSCDELDCLVELLSGARGVFGARLSGGGFGGAVMALADSSFTSADADAVSKAYEAKFGKKPSVFACESGDGAKVI
nr:galactokinase [Opitutales bacterium]